MKMEKHICWQNGTENNFTKYDYIYDNQSEVIHKY